MTDSRLIVTFPTTTSAIAFERICKSEEVPGRLIPVPPQVKAGCGLAWLTIREQQPRLMALIQEFDLIYEALIDLKETGAK